MVMALQLRLGTVTAAWQCRSLELFRVFAQSSRVIVDIGGWLGFRRGGELQELVMKLWCMELLLAGLIGVEREW